MAVFFLLSVMAWCMFSGTFIAMNFLGMARGHFFLFYDGFMMVMVYRTSAEIYHQSDGE